MILMITHHCEDENALFKERPLVYPRLVVDCEPGPAKTRRAPSRLCRDARSMVIYDYGMQDY